MPALGLHRTSTCYNNELPRMTSLNRHDIGEVRNNLAPEIALPTKFAATRPLDFVALQERKRSWRLQLMSSMGFKLIRRLCQIADREMFFQELPTRIVSTDSKLVATFTHSFCVWTAPSGDRCGVGHRCILADARHFTLNGMASTCRIQLCSWVCRWRPWR